MGVFMAAHGLGEHLQAIRASDARGLTPGLLQKRQGDQQNKDQSGQTNQQVPKREPLSAHQVCVHGTRPFDPRDAC